MKISYSKNAKTPIKLKVNLENMPHSVYRRILVPEDINMLQLHFVIQLAMGWEFAHLFQFSDKKYDATIMACIPYVGDDLLYLRRTRQTKADQVKLKNEFQDIRNAKPFWYWYDFGDDWWHKITFQKPTKKEMQIFNGSPMCVEACGVCPPEDVGGPWGYAQFLDIILNKKHPEYEEYREWAGIPIKGKYDEEFVDIEFVNKNLEYYYRSAEWKITADEYFEE